MDLGAFSAAEPESDAAAPLDLDAWDESGDEEEEVGSEESYASLSGVKFTDREPLDLGAEQAEEEDFGDQAHGFGGQDSGVQGGPDELLLDSSNLAGDEGPANSPLVQRRRLGGGEGFGGGAGGGAGGGGGGQSPAQGATLFERMANLSRGSRSDEEEDGEEGDEGASISIPRFLGRQNNQ